MGTAVAGGSNGLPVYLVDANPNQRANAAAALAGYYDVREFGEASAVLSALEAQPPAVLVLDGHVMPKGGLAVLKAAKEMPGLAETAILCTDGDPRGVFLANAQRLKVQALLEKPVSPEKLFGLVTKAVTRRLERGWAGLDDPGRAALVRCRKVFGEAVEALGNENPLPFEGVAQACQPLVSALDEGQAPTLLAAVDGHPDLMFVHAVRSAVFLALFGGAMGLATDDRITIAAGGLLQDLGKAGVGAEVLKKRGPLEPREWKAMRAHVWHTVAFLRRSKGVRKGAITIAEQHHERLDGSGYPWGLAGEELNELARMAGIVDVYAAMTERRLHRDALSPQEALKTMAGMGDKLDQRMVKAFTAVLLKTLEQAGDTPVGA